MRLIELKVMNPRIILLENLRQSCIYHTYRVENLDMYWNYMINFAEACADPKNPLFTEECAVDMLKFTGIDEAKIIACMEEEFKSNDSF
jgi:hypothetical protein